jgi:arylsulfatase A-like enzyme
MALVAEHCCHRSLGFHNESYMPTGRGFDTFFGYLGGMEDHFTQELGAMIGCSDVVDLTSDGQPAYGENGTYSGWMYNSKAVAVVSHATEPFFLNYWLQNTHAPFEVPPQYSDLYSFPGNERLEVFNGMVSVVDAAVGNVTAALKARQGTWVSKPRAFSYKNHTDELNVANTRSATGSLKENTLLIYTHDNGAPLGGGGSNFPVIVPVPPFSSP